VIGTFGIMKLVGFSLDNLSLMALTISTGFVVDDAIVMIETSCGSSRWGRAAGGRAQGAKQIGFTVISLSISLVAVFIPLLFMTGLWAGCSANCDPLSVAVRSRRWFR